MTEPPGSATTGTPSEIPAETRLENEPANPFEVIRGSTLIPWMILGGLLLLAAVHLPSLVTPLDPGDPATGEVTRMPWLYGALPAWIVRVNRYCKVAENQTGARWRIAEYP